jgi:hypothetical protein
MTLPASLEATVARLLLPTLLPVLLVLPGLVLPPPAQAQDRRAREALALADGLGHLGATLRAYGQLGQQVNEVEAAALLARARDDFDATLQRLLRRGSKRLPAAEGERLSQRWRSVRDATFTRPSPEIGALMGDIGDDIAGQLQSLLPLPAGGAAPGNASGAVPRHASATASGSAGGAQFERAWQRQNLQWLAKEGVFGCWRPDFGRWARIDSLREQFDRWLAAQEKHLPQVNWVQYNAQWNLLTTSLPRAGAHGCTQQSLRSLVETADRLVGMITAQPL